MVLRRDLVTAKILGFDELTNAPSTTNRSHPNLFLGQPLIEIALLMPATPSGTQQTAVVVHATRTYISRTTTNNAEDRAAGSFVLLLLLLQVVRKHDCLLLL